jgi:hypothetical protein
MEPFLVRPAVASVSAVRVEGLLLADIEQLHGTQINPLMRQVASSYCLE